MRKLVIVIGALSVLVTFIAPANACQNVWVCHSDSNGSQSCHWERQGFDCY